jgi:hypothetical protein
LPDSWSGAPDLYDQIHAVLGFFFLALLHLRPEQGVERKATTSLNKMWIVGYLKMR